MILKKNTSPAPLEVQLSQQSPNQTHSTFVGSLRVSSQPAHPLLFSTSPMPALQRSRTPDGLVLLKSTPLSPHFSLFQRLSSGLTFKPYAHTLELLRRHQTTLRKQERDPHLSLNIAWISLATSPIVFNKRALESFELALTHTLFLETRQPQQSVEALCSESQFDAIVAELPATPVILKRAQRWLKPAAHDPLKPEPANTLETHPRERLFILISDPEPRKTGVRS